MKKISLATLMFSLALSCRVEADPARAEMHGHHASLRRPLCPLDPACRAGQLCVVRAEQHAPRRGRIDARHVGAWTGRRAEYRARSPVHLHAGHGRRRRGAGHSRQSGRELCASADVLPDRPLHRPAAPAHRKSSFL